MSKLRDRYFEWLCDIVDDREMRYMYTHHSRYTKLLSYLFTKEFTYILPMDENRFEDGVDLRYRFGYEQRIPDPIIASELDDRPCSVLEMMVALALRCEEQLMSNTDIGTRTPRWFWEMVKSLGLINQDDGYFDQQMVAMSVQIFLDRSYNRDGRGGLFTIPDIDRDMRNAEIWYQAMWYFSQFDI